MIELNDDEVDHVSGAINYGDLAAGGIGLGLTIAGILAAPATAGTSLLVVGAVAGGLGSGILLREAFRDN